MWFEIFLTTLGDFCIFGTIKKSVVAALKARVYILTTRQRGNENPEFRQIDRCRLQTDPSWE
jgi:hypothetical protein